jgi:hypothetical protein
VTTRSNRTDGREFVFLSVDIASHPKVLGMADPAAAWGYAAAVAYCGKYLTDGWITIQTIAREGGISTQKARKLVAADLVHEHGHTCKKCPEIPKGKAYLHDYLEHNRSKTEADEQRRSKAEAGRKGAEKRWATPTVDTAHNGQNGHGTCHSTSQGNRHHTSHGTCMAEEEKEITTHPGKAATDSNAHVRASKPDSEQPPTGPAITGRSAVSAKHLVQRVIGPEFPATVRTALAIEVAQLIAHYPEPVLVQALETWKGRTGIGPRILPTLVADIVKGQVNGMPNTPYGVRSSGSGARSAKIQATIAAGEALQARLDAAGSGHLVEGASLRLLDGGRSA